MIRNVARDLERRIVLEPGSLARTGLLVLDPERAHYVRDVLRLRVGGEIGLMDGDGVVGLASITRIDRTEVALDVREIVRKALPLGVAVTLIQGIGKGDKMDTVVRQVTELGARRIRPAITARTVPRPSARSDRWRTIAEDAMRVSGRAHRPVIDPPAPLGTIFDGPRAALSLCLTVDAERSLRDVFEAADQVVDTVEVLVGPEGGLTEGEVESVRNRGFTTAHLGRAVLRTETAGPAAVAALMLLGGGYE